MLDDPEPDDNLVKTPAPNIANSGKLATFPTVNFSLPDHPVLADSD